MRMIQSDSSQNFLERELQELLFSSVERIIMTKNHLDSIHNYILRRDRDDNQTHVYFESLKKILKGIIHYTQACFYGGSSSNKLESFKKLYSLFKAIRDFQTHLVFLPKEDAPVELHRFLRIFHRDGLPKSGEGGQSVQHVLYLGEKYGAATFESSPLAEFEEKQLNILLSDVDVIDSSISGKTQDKPYHIIIPRMETSASLYWPILAHEIAHQIMKPGVFDSGNIMNDWVSHHGSLDDPKNKNFLHDFKRSVDDQCNTEDTKILASWLTECWCDLYAYFAVGPAFIFAQKGAFLFNIWDIEDGNLLGDEKHPPAYIRLILLFRFGQMLHKGLLDAYDEIGLLPRSFFTTMLSPNDNSLRHSFNNVASMFYEFFNVHFDLENDNLYDLKDHIKAVKERAYIYDEQKLKDLIKRLDQNYPVPSLITDTKNLTEKETTVQEVMLAAWLSYEKSSKKETISYIFDNLNEIHQLNHIQLWDSFAKKVIPKFDKFNESVLRSLQIGEWVNLLKSQSSDQLQNDEHTLDEGKSRFCVSCSGCEPTLLTDHEIRTLIQTDQLKVIPLIDASKQIGACSLDVRLGPSFQTYQPNQSGVVDLIDDISVKNVFKNSTIVDLDFLGSIVLAPGQFVLSNTMEYIGLPENIAAQVEGRSSFARLGLQVHMTANLIDPGFHGSVTFEIFNAGPNPIRLFPGYRIGQLRFFKSKQPLRPYNIKIGAKFKGMFIHSTSLLDKRDDEVKKIKSEIDIERKKEE